MKKLLYILILFCFLNCQDINSKKAIEDLKKELEICKKENLELKKTAAQIYLQAQNYLTAGESEKAKIEYQKVIDKFPQSPEAGFAKTIINQIDYEIKKDKETAEKIKNLGFKSLEEKTIIKQDFVTLKINNIQIAKRWIFDRYESRYFYRDAERGRKFITADVNITSVIKEPLLPPFYLYQLINNNLQFVTTINYSFYRWNDYGSYLGNSPDYGNDFAHSETIKFTIGGDFEEYLINDYPMFLLVKKESCAFRHYERFNNPTVVYLTGECEADNTLTVEKALNDFFTIKIFNKNKI